MTDPREQVHDDFRQTFERVRNIVVMGKAHLELWRGLSKRLFADDKRVVLNTAPTFFGMTLESHLDAAFLDAAKIFDKSHNSLNLRTVLKKALAMDGALSIEAFQQVERAVTDANAKISTLESSLTAIRTRRDKLIAHLDPRAVKLPDEIAQKSKITADELQNVFEVASDILNSISCPCWGFFAHMHLIDVDDFEHALDLIAREKQRQFAEYEAEFGPFPYPSNK